MSRGTSSKNGLRDRLETLRHRLREARSTPGGSLATMAGMAAAGAAGVAAALHYLRRGGRSTFDVTRGEEGWMLLVDGSDEPVRTFSTKRQAVKVARALASNSPPSDLSIRTEDGEVQKAHSYDTV